MVDDLIISRYAFFVISISRIIILVLICLLCLLLLV